MKYSIPWHERQKNILEKYFDEHTIIVKDNSYLHKGHNNFDGNNETHILVHLKKKSKLKLNRMRYAKIKVSMVNVISTSKTIHLEI